MKNVRAFITFVALALGAAGAVPFPAGAASALAPLAPSLRQLHGVDELKSWFNSYKGHPRLIFLVSPT